MADKTPATTIRLTDEDRTLITELKKRLGMTSTTQIIRLALRSLASQPIVRNDTKSDTTVAAISDTNE